MTQKTTTPEPKVSSTWERLEDFVREHVQRFIQALLEEEVTESAYPPRSGWLAGLGRLKDG
jgi:hypothetical protein